MHPQLKYIWILISLQLLAVVRAHITALGGNAMVSFYMSELILVDNPHKNQVILSILPGMANAAGRETRPIEHASSLFLISGSNVDQCGRRCSVRFIFFQQLTFRSSHFLWVRVANFAAKNNKQ